MKNVFINNDEYQGQAYTYESYAETRILRVRIQKRNKQSWPCLYCSMMIPKGSGSAYHTGLQNGEFYSYHVCLGCYDGAKTEETIR